jgi:hypothetical protein
MRDWNTRHRLPVRGAVLDGCGGIGGVAHGLVRAGLDVYGVDSNPALEEDYMKSGAKGFYCRDILEALEDRDFMAQFSGASVSPPCQNQSQMSNCRPGLAATYAQLIGPCRDRLAPLGIPFVIENVSGSRRLMNNPETLCMWGHFGRHGYRHRLVEAGGGLVLKSPAATSADVPVDHTPSKRPDRPNWECGQPHPVAAARAGHWKPGRFVSVAGHERREPVRAVMEMPWATRREDVAEAVPWYMAYWWGTQLREQMEMERAA